MNAGLTKLVNQVVGGAGKELNEALQSSSRHSGAGRNPESPDALDPRLRGNDNVVADRNPVTLSGATIASNRRTADALKRRTTVGDLPTFTVDAINTDGETAVYEVADMIEQVHASDPMQAKELLRNSVQHAASAMAVKSSAFRLAPPIRPPSTSASASSSAAFDGFIEPP